MFAGALDRHVCCNEHIPPSLPPSESHPPPSFLSSYQPPLSPTTTTITTQPLSTQPAMMCGMGFPSRIAKDFEYAADGMCGKTAPVGGWWNTFPVPFYKSIKVTVRADPIDGAGCFGGCVEGGPDTKTERQNTEFEETSRVKTYTLFRLPPPRALTPHPATPGTSTSGERRTSRWSSRGPVCRSPLDPNYRCRPTRSPCVNLWNT